MLLPIHLPRQGNWRLNIQSFNMERKVCKTIPRPQHAAALHELAHPTIPTVLAAFKLWTVGQGETGAGAWPVGVWLAKPLHILPLPDAGRDACWAV